MSTARQTLDRLDREHAALGRRLAPKWTHWLALLLSAAVPILAWHAASRFTDERAERRYEHEAGNVADVLVRRLERRLEPLPAGSIPSAGTVGSLMTGVLDPERRLVGLSLEAGGRTLHADERPPDPAHASRRVVRRAGGDWTVRLWSTPGLERRARRYLPWAVLVGGSMLDALVLALFVAQARGARRALRYAKNASILSNDLDRTATELAQVNGELERFARVVSHDLKQPVQGTAGLLDVIAMDVEEECEPKVRELLEPTVAKARRKTSDMQRLIDSILTSSTLAARDRESDEVDAGELVRGIGRALDIDDDRLVVEGDMPRVRTDGTRLYQVLANLVQNAFRYHDDPDRARVVVSAAVADGTIRFRVADNGPGIAPEHHARVFEPFESLPETARPGSTGIGLSIVKEAVEAVGGRLRLESTLGAGAEFEFTWPA